MIGAINYNLNKVNLYEQIADSLEQAIVQSKIKTEKLPSEQELSRQFKVSRTVIREALKVLKERGLIESRNGGCSSISKPNTDTVSSVLNRIIRMDNISNDDLHHLRLILETAAVRLAALHSSPAELEHLESTLAKMTDKTLPESDRVSLDADFHITIARASKNELLGMFVEVMTILLDEYMLKGIFGPSGIEKTLKQHNKVLKAIKARKPELAEAALQEHLIASRGNVDKYEQKKGNYGA